MALQSSTGYVRVGINLGWDNRTLIVSWLTFSNSDWRNNNSQRVWKGIAESGTITFDLAIKETQLDEATGEQVETILGYHPQSPELAHELLKNLSGRDCNFKAVNFQIVI